jgi:hypothetical protein
MVSREGAELWVKVMGIAVRRERIGIDSIWG